MSFASDDAFKERIREATDIVDLVQQYRPLTRSGRKYLALCPFHDDSRPSLNVDPEHQTYKCWVCQEGGDVFSFIMKMENLGFREALEMLAERAGIPLPKKKQKKIFLKPTGPNAELAAQGHDDDESGYVTENEYAGEEPQEVDRKTLMKAIEWLAAQYHHALLTLDEAEIARKYLEDRKINAESIRKFQIGYAPSERDWLAKRVVFDKKRLQILELVGNLRPSKLSEEGQEGAGYYDFFRGRVMFPIRNDLGKPVAFGGRVIPGTPLAQKDVGKYMNTPDTPLYTKHRILFGFDFAKQKMRSTRRALIMEGYTDVIIAHQFGFEDAVAACGTAVGPEHIRKLKSHVEKILLVLDGDKAGTTSAARVLGDFVAEGADMAVVTLPSGLDPAEFLEQHGAEAFKMFLDTEAVDALEHAFRIATRGIDLDHDVIASSNALDELITTVAKTPVNERKFDDPLRLRVEKTLQYLSHRFAVPQETVRKRFNDKQQRERERELTRRNTDDGKDFVEPAEADSISSFRENLPDSLERNMLELWLVDPTTLYEFWEPIPPERCRSPITRMIYDKCNEIVERKKTPTFDRLIVAFDDPKMKSFLVELGDSGRSKLAVHTPPIVADPAEEETPDVRDEVGELEESLRNRENERKIPPETRERLVREILDGFDQRDQERRRIKEVDQLRGVSLTEEEKLQQLLQMQAKESRLQEERKKKLGLSE